MTKNPKFTMASQSLHPSFVSNQNINPTNPTKMSKREEKRAKTKRAIRSLAIAVSIPLSLNILIVLLFGSGHQYRSLKKPIWFPPLWLIHLASLGSSVLTSFAAWLFWADSGFHLDPNALPLYIAQVSMSVVWDPLVLVIGSVWLGLIANLVHLGTLFACYRAFRRVNPFAKDVIKPCLAWLAYLTLVNYKLMYL